MNKNETIAEKQKLNENSKRAQFEFCKFQRLLKAVRCLCDEVFNYMKVCNPSVAGGCELRRALENVKDALALFSNSLKNENSDDAIITPVNNAACRNALEKILEKIDKWRTDNVMEHWQYSQLFDIANWAIAEPPRQCDVGTAEEQSERFSDFCLSHQKTLSVEDNGEVHTRCDKCPIQEIHANVEHDEAIICGIDWAQMPYNESEAKNEQRT